MPVGGGNPKKLGDGMIVMLRPEFCRGGSDIQDTVDAIVALMEELDLIYADAVANIGNGNAFTTALATRGRRTIIQLLDRQDAP